MGNSTTDSSFLAGSNPLLDPICLFILQTVIIIVTSRTISLGLKRLGQPRVIGEVIGGILLGKSAMCKIPAFKNNVFPDSSMAGLSLVANIGLILFLFMVGLELDLSLMFRSVRKAATISICSIVLPFALSLGSSQLLYNTYMTDTNVPYLSFVLFNGVAMSITAFPILARILSEKNLMHTEIGQITMSAAAIDDAVSWILLLVVVALVNNSGQYLTAVYVFLMLVAWTAVLFFVIRPLFKRLIARADQHIEGLFWSLIVFLAFLITLISAWITEGAGVHAIFGAFLAGLMIPHEHGLAIKLTERIEDLIMVIFLPLYFAYSGLNVRIDQLDTGIAWGMILLVIFIGCVGKILGSFVAGVVVGLGKREALAVGVLMNTRGLIQLIVLNLGLQADVINVEVYTIMVMMALATTFMTAPIMSIVYPSSMNVIVRTKSKKVGSLLIEGNVIDGGAEGGVGSADGEKWALGVGGETKDQYIKGDSLLFDEEAAAAAAAFPRSSRSLSRSRSRKSNNDLKQEAEDPRKILIILTDISSVRPAMSLLQIVSSSVHHLVKVTALRLIPLDDRFGSALKVQESDEVLRTDHVLGTFKTFAQLSKTPIESIQLFITREQDFASSIASCAEENESSIIILSHCSLEPDSIAGGGELRQWGMAKQVCEIAKCSVAVMNDRGFNIGEDMSLNQKHQPEINDSSPNSGRSTSAFIKIKSLPVASARPASVFVPFIGGADDREALTLALEFQKGINTFVLVMKTKDEVGVDSDSAPVAAVVLEIDGGVFASGQEKSIPLPPYPSPSRTQPSIPQITNSAAADEDFIRILQKKINNDKDPSNVLSMETATVSQGGEYGLMMNWLRTSDLSQGDMIVFGRKMYDMFVEYSMMEAQSGGGSYYQLNTSFNGGGSGVSGGSRREHLKTVIERETGCSVCIVHSK